MDIPPPLAVFILLRGGNGGWFDCRYSLVTVEMLGVSAFFNCGVFNIPLFSLLPKPLPNPPPYRPPERNVAHLFAAAVAIENDESRICFGPMLMYFGSKRLKPFIATSRDSFSVSSIELFEFNFFDNVFVFDSNLFELPADALQAGDSQ